jgi:DNA-binding MarR family transcriptional regulator
MAYKQATKLPTPEFSTQELSNPIGSDLADIDLAESVSESEEGVHLEHFITYRLNVLSNMMNRQIGRMLNQQFDISLPDWRVLAILGRFQNMSVRDVAARSQMDKAMVSRSVARLVKRDLVSSQATANDGRLVALSLTVAGQEMYAAIMPIALERQQHLSDCLTDEERVAFDRAIDKLMRVVDEL